MHSPTISNPLRFSSGRPYEWHDVNYLESARSRPARIVPQLMVLWIACADLCLPQTNLSILYVVPLILVALTANSRTQWRFATLLIGLTFGIYFLKNTLHASEDASVYLNYRLVNRTLVALTILAMGYVLNAWRNWREEQRDSELTESMRHQEAEISSTFAVICCVPLVLLIACLDYLIPANFNLAILYPIPLFVCGWTRSRRLLWSMLAILLALTALGCLWCPPPTIAGHEISIYSNRILAACGLTAVTVILGYWMKRADDGPA